MRYPVEQKAETHERIIDAAARSFREHGSEGQGLAQLMKDAGLTHGGFYRHFESKEDLYVNAIARGFQEAADGMIAAAAKAPQGEQLRTIIERYLSVEHLEDPGGGCVLSTLAAEIARQRPAVRARINAAMKSTSTRASPVISIRRPRKTKSGIEMRRKFDMPESMRATSTDPGTRVASRM